MEKSSPSRLNSPKVQYLLKIIFGKAPKPFKNSVHSAFSKFSYVLLRQRQLDLTKFSCDTSHQNNDVKELCKKFNLNINDVDPDRLIWLPVETLAKFLIRPGQWVSLSRYQEGTSKNVDEFKCQIAPQLSGSLTTIQVNSVTEYNLRRALSIPQFMDIPALRMKPVLTEPLIKTTNQSLTFSPIHGKSVKLSRMKSSFEVNLRECDLLIEDAFVNCKYVCVGDIISLPYAHLSVDLVVHEINGKREEEDYKELLKVTRSSSRVSLTSFEALNQFHLRGDDETVRKLLAPCLRHCFQKMYGWIRQALVSEHKYKGLEVSRDNLSELWPNILIYGPIGSGKLSACQTLASAFGLNFYFLNGANLIGDTSAYTEGKLKAVYDKVRNSLCPALIYVKNLHLVGKDKDGNEDKRVVIAFEEFLHDFADLSTDSSVNERKNVMWSRAVFIVGSTDSPEKLAPSISQNFIFKLEFPGIVKSISETESTLRWLLEKSGVRLGDEVELEFWVKNNCEGMQRSFGDLKALAAGSVRNAFARMGTSEKAKDPKDHGLLMNLDDLNCALNALDSVLKKAASTVEVPKVSWEDIGGLEDIKKELINSVRLPLEFPHLFVNGIRRSGILLYGPPGTGKTLIAKAVATEFKLSFLSVKGPELLNMYVGQSEQNVRDVFEKARNAAPCIIFFDELDSLAPNRGRAGDSGGVMDRVVSQILAELDGTHSSSDVFVIGATNRPDLIDSALLRPGRFDKLLYVGLSKDTESKAKVLGALTRKFNLAGNVDLSQLASMLPKGMSGADLYSLCSDAYMTAIERNISLASTKECEHFKGAILIEKGDFEIAISRVVTSLSDVEQAKYEALKEMKR